MKIVYLSGAPLPSAAANSVHVVKMCRALGALGHEVVLFAPRPAVPEVYEFYGVDRTFSIEWVGHPRFRGSGHYYGLRIASMARRMGVDLCIGRHPTACAAACAFGMPTYFEIHGPIEDLGRLSRQLVRRMMTAASLRGLVVVTHALADYYRRTFPFAADKVIVAADAADPVAEDIAPMPVRKAGVLNVGYVGHLYPGKGMEIISELVPACQFAHFHIVGGRQPDVDYWSSQLGYLPNVTFYGHVQHSDAQKYIRAFDVVLLPNQERVQGNAGRDIGAWTSPLKLFEYMAARRPIVASDLPVLREVLEDGRNARLCEPGDPAAWRRVLLELASGHDERHRLAAAAYAEFRQYFTWEMRAKRLIQGIHA